MKNPTQSKLFVIIFLALYVFASVNLLSHIEKNPIHTDEPGWVSSANYYTDLLLQGDFNHQKWECVQCFNWGSLNTHLGQWIIGAFLKVVVPQQEPVFFKFYIHGVSLDENIKQGTIPPRQTLLAARSIPAIFGILCGILIFFIGYYAYNKWIGSLAALLLLGNPLFITLSTQAMTDVYYHFFLLCGCLSSLFLLKLHSDRKLLLVSGIYGSFVGLASSVKITGLVLAGLHFFLIILTIKLIYRLSLRNVIQYLAVFCSSALIIIYLLNPYFWPDFSDINTEQLIKEVKTLYSEANPEALKTETLLDKYPQLSDELYQKPLIDSKVSLQAAEFMVMANLPPMLEDYPQLSKLSHPLEFPKLFIRWKNLMNIQLGYWPLGWKENRSNLNNDNLFIEYSTFPLEWCFLCIGMYFYGRKIVSAFLNGQAIESFSPFLYFVINYVFILAFMKLNWDRYYLPTIIAGKIIVAVGVYETFKISYAFLFGNRSTS